MNEDVQQAFRMQQAGRFADAARQYSAILSRNPEDAQALHWFGVLHHQNGFHARAAELMGRAVAAQPDIAEFHANFAEAQRALGENERAEESCRTALRLRPGYPEAANNLGLALHAQGRFAEAVTQFETALSLRPDFATVQNNLGTSLLELGRIGPALGAYRRAVELDPRLASARSNLGQLLVDQGEAEEGLVQCLESVRLQPGVPAALNNLGNAYRALERWDEAADAYTRAQAMAAADAKYSSELPQILANRGQALFLEGKRPQAFAFFQQAVDLAPNDVSIWQYLAIARDANEEHAAALEAWQKIVELMPRSADAHNALGWSLNMDGRHDEAGASYRRALALAPGHIDALLNLGSWHEEAGDMEQAEACFRRARELRPHAPAPLARLAQLLRGKLPDADRRDIEMQLGLAAGGQANTSLPPQAPARGPLLYGLAQVLDSGGEYVRAAQCLEEANGLALRERRRQGKKYDAAEHSGLVDRIIQSFTPALFDRLGGFGDETTVPVFVFGMPRSGTTLVEQILSSHSLAHGAGELPFACEAFEAIPKIMDMPDDMQACLSALHSVAVRELSRRYLDGVSKVVRASPASHRAQESDQIPRKIIDKMPDNYLYVGLLNILFPRAAFIHVKRDLRDVAVSCWMTNFRSIRWADDKGNLSGRCRDYQRLMRHWQNVLPRPVHEVVYESLVDDFDREAPRLVAACGLEWEAGCGRFHQTARPVRTASVTQVRQPLYRKAVARWKHYEQPLADLFERLPAEKM